MSDHGPKKHSIEQIIEHMTAERNVDGQYIPLGFAPPQSNANLPHWPEYNVNQNIHPQFIRNDTYDRNIHYGMDPAMMQSQSELQQSYFYHQQMLSESRLLDYSSGGGCRFQPGAPFRAAQRSESELLPLGGFVPYHQADARDCGMFADAQRRAAPAAFLPSPPPAPPAMAVERPNTSARTTQTAPRPTEVRPRAVAEVRPMRPSYSDVLASAPPAQPKPTQPAQPKTKGTASKGSKTRKAAALKRQLSSGSDEAAPGNGNGNGGRAPVTNPGTPRDSDAGFAATRKWASLDGLDADSEQAFAPEEVGGARGSKGKAKKQAGEWEGALNNRKPAGSAAAGKAGSGGQSTGGRRPLHINNNLLAGSNDWPAAADEKNLVKRPPCRTCADDKKGTGNGTGKPEPKRPARSNSSSGPEGRRRGGGAGGGAGGGGRGKRRPSSSPLASLCRPMRAQLGRLAALAALALAWFLHLLSDVAGMSSRLAVHWCGQAGSRLATTARTTLSRAAAVLCKLRVPARLSALRLPWFRGADPPAAEPRFERAGMAGLEANMALPATGEEAMKRLLGCKGKDPYSILGVTPTCSDDDVKKYYKRQAFLVHPDKNGQPGAEEAFKILVHAFELIGEPERREAYERRVAETVQAEAAWSELSELLRALHQKMEYAANTIRCTNCGKRHRRVAAQRPCYAARACAQCKIHHAAREGDIWAESTLMGLRWRYFACMDGAVFDITEWAACQHENLRHLKANTHAVQYRIVLGKQRPSRPARPDNAAGQSQGSEPDLEDFLANLYSQGGVASGGGGGSTSDAKVDTARSRKKPRPRKK